MKNLLQALVNMHAEFGVTLVDDRKGVRSPYVSLMGTLEQITEMTSKHGLKVTQKSIRDGQLMILSTRLSHPESGEFDIAETILNTTSSTPGMTPDQAWGSSCTYKRRYEIMTILGLFCHGDPTDNDQQHEPVTLVINPRNETDKSEYISSKQLGLLNQKLKDQPDKAAKLTNRYKSLDKIPWRDFQEVLAWANEV